MTTFQCKKCGHSENAMHLREVSVSLGWTSSTVRTVAPCSMCSRCGDLSVHAEITIGKFMNLIPGSANVPPPGQPVAQPAGVKAPSRPVAVPSISEEPRASTPPQ